MHVLDNAPRVRTRTAGDRKVKRRRERKEGGCVHDDGKNLQPTPSSLSRALSPCSPPPSLASLASPPALLSLQIDQLADLAVLNARLAPPGAPGTPDPTEVRKRLEFLRTRRALWARVYEAVTRRDVAATLAVIEAATAEVESALGERAGGRVGVGELGARLAGLRVDVAAARARLASSSAALAASASRLAALRADADALEAALARGQAWAEAGGGEEGSGGATAVAADDSQPSAAPPTSSLWWPIAFSSSIRPGSLAAFDLAGDPWVLLRPHATAATPTPPVSCLLDECAHRACPLSLGAVTPGGAAQCPYHGWSFAAGSGALVDAPSTRARPRGVSVPVLPVVEADGVVWAWRPPGGAAALRVVAVAAAATAEEGEGGATPNLPPLLPPGPPPPAAAPPPGYVVVAEATAETIDPPTAVLARLAAGRAALGASGGGVGAAEPGGLLLRAVLRGGGGLDAASSPPVVATQVGSGMLVTAAGPPRPGDDGGSRPLRLLHVVSPSGGPSNRSGCRLLLRVCVSEDVPWLARAGPGAAAGWAALAEAAVREDAGPPAGGGVPEVGAARTAGER